MVANGPASSSSFFPPQTRFTVQSLPSSSSHVVLTYQATASIDGQDTEVILQEYEDRTMVVVTQIGRIGCLVQASLPSETPHLPYASQYADDDDEEDDVASRSTANSSSDGPNLPQVNPALVQTPLLGTPPAGEEPLYHLYVSLLYSLLRPLPASSSEAESTLRDLRPVVVGLGLRLRPREAQQGDDLEAIDEEAEKQRVHAVVALVRECIGKKTST